MSFTGGPGSSQPQTILLVEDDKSLRTVLRELLRHSGHTVIECSNAHEALTVIDRRGGAIGVMITDYALPGMNGVALAREVARVAPWIQTLITSGHITPRMECRRMNGVSFLSKPFGTHDLLRAI